MAGAQRLTEHTNRKTEVLSQNICAGHGWYKAYLYQKRQNNKSTHKEHKHLTPVGVKVSLTKTSRSSVLIILRRVTNSSAPGALLVAAAVAFGSFNLALSYPACFSSGIFFSRRSTLLTTCVPAALLLLET